MPRIDSQTQYLTFVFSGTTYAWSARPRSLLALCNVQKYAIVYMSCRGVRFAVEFSYGKGGYAMMVEHLHPWQSVMTTDVTSLPPSASVLEAAKLMKELNVGAIPICDGRRLIGMLTDRDVVVRLVAEQRDPSEQVHTVMSGQVDYCYEDQDVDEAVHIMQDRQ